MSTKIMCYKCRSNRIVKNGISSNGYQKYRCSNCGHSYTSQTEYVGFSASYKRPTSTNQSAQVRDSSLSTAPKTEVSANKVDVILTILFGWLGYWRFKKGQTGLGILWLLTYGLFFIGWIVDIIQVCQACSSTSKPVQSTRNMQAPSSYVPPVSPTQPDATSHPVPVIQTAQAVQPVPEPPRPTLAKFKDGKQLKYSYHDVDLYTLPDQIPDFDRVKKYSFVDFVQEPENTYDSKAVYVAQDGVKLGYLNKGNIQNMVNDFIRRGDKVVGFLSDIDEQNHKFKIDMGFYKPIQILSKVTLVGNKREEVQSDVLDCYEGDEVTIEYDIIEETYNVLNSYSEFIGKLPKYLNNKLDDYDEINGYIYSIDEKTDSNYNSYYAVVVALFE